MHENERTRSHFALFTFSFTNRSVDSLKFFFWKYEKQIVVFLKCFNYCFIVSAKAKKKQLLSSFSWKPVRLKKKGQIDKLTTKEAKTCPGENQETFEHHTLILKTHMAETRENSIEHTQFRNVSMKWHSFHAKSSLKGVSSKSDFDKKKQVWKDKLKVCTFTHHECLLQYAITMPKYSLRKSRRIFNLLETCRLAKFVKLHAATAVFSPSKNSPKRRTFSMLDQWNKCQLSLLCLPRSQRQSNVRCEIVKNLRSCVKNIRICWSPQRI